MGRISGTRKIPARPPLVCARSVPELQAGDVCPKITNSSKTGRAHGQAASGSRDSPLSCRGVGAGQVSRDRLPAKNHGRMTPRKLGTNSSHTERVHDRAASGDRGDLHRSICAELGRTSKDSLPTNKTARRRLGIVAARNLTMTGAV